MKEQVSVDKQKIIDDLVKSAFDGNPKYCFVEIVELERLKRLDENVNKLKDMLKTTLKTVTQPRSRYQFALDLLESLDK